MLDKLTKEAITHTRHCLTGCGIGEILGMAVGQNLSNAVQTLLAVIGAFTIGYSLTFWSARKSGMGPKSAFKLALAIDTVSIFSMEIIDNTSEWLIPGAISAHLNDFLFWWSLALSLAIAFMLTVPVNRFMMNRGVGHSHQHHH